MTLPRTGSVLLAVLVCVLPAHNAGADQDSHHKAVERLFELTHMKTKIDESVDNVLALQLRQDPAMAEYRDLLRAFLEKYVGWESLKDDLFRMYMAEFSEQELAQINAFYATPAGRKVIERVPLLVQERNRLAQQRLREHVGELREQIRAAQAEKP